MWQFLIWSWTPPPLIPLVPGIRDANWQAQVAAQADPGILEPYTKTHISAGSYAPRTGPFWKRRYAGYSGCGRGSASILDTPCSPSFLAGARRAHSELPGHSARTDVRSRPGQPAAEGHARFSVPTIGDAILNHLAHNTYRLALKGESWRVLDSPLPMPTT
jgi:hypothetical protein